MEADRGHQTAQFWARGGFMVDQALLSRALTDFARTLVRRCDIGEVLYELTDRVVEVLAVDGAGVSLGRDGGPLQSVTATGQVVARLESLQEAEQSGPCHQAYMSGQALALDDLTATDRRPPWTARILQQGIRAVAGLPMRQNGGCLGALNVYSTRPRRWQEEELVAAQMMADMATSYVLNAAELEHATRLTQQLQHALDSRIVIEQAKGILAERLQISVADAFGILRSHARNHGAKLHAVARAVVEGTAQL